ncbi:putative disease resistance protein At4g10780 [Gossypium hirsutum]|uniref:Disease resistance protein At4g10780 n=1 Tax=Gossypium hirsutum TaxID=3635 RepID=A0A1U8M4I6_GOSHI|nr:putative disease resistance protein At4g10780 [Gossypium hirsutum]XP_016721702.1 putative disease resistance protein At4g10780 [Gossypium hirsutum]
MELVGPICEVLKCLGDPTCTYIEHHRKLEERKNDLLAKQRQLHAMKSDVELRIKAEFRWGRRVRQEVENWLLDVQAINDKIQNIEERMQNVSCFSRARLGKRIAQTVEQVEGIIERGSFTEALVIDTPSTAGVPFQLEHLEGETMVKEDIWNYLMSDEIGMIGVSGMGGIGKTTIMKHIHNQLLEETKALFDKIIWVTVSKELNIPKLQEKLANALNIVDLPKSEPERVAELMEKLGQRRYVLVLDDVGEKFSLAEVGIPKPTSSNGSKLVLTSRSIEVCRSMDCKVVKVPPLSHEESMNLFLEHAGHGVLKVPSLKEILGNIVRECGGLPLAIAVIAESMKGIYDVAEWRNALRELRDHVRSVKGTDVEIYERLKFSFDRLGDLKIQSCFLLCSLYPEDHKIPREELIEYWIDEEFLGTGSRQELSDRGHTILNRLENNCLLEKDGRNTVKMHDVMRDTALYIKSSGPHFMVKSGIGLKELPSKQEWGEHLEKVSFMENNVLEIPRHLSPNCEILSTLFLQYNMSLKRISESFFQHMHSLSILSLSYTGIEQLPNSVLNLETLNALVLRGCYNLKYVFTRKA